jgi:hypothetical protein
LTVNTTSRIPIIDSEIYALHGDHEMIDTIGTTHVSDGAQTIVDIHSAVETRIVHEGDPIQANFTITNLGNTTLDFSSGLDRFTMEMGNQNIWDDPYPYDQPIPPEYQFPPTLEPSENFTQTLTWHQPPFAPGTYELRCKFYLKSLPETYGSGSYLFGSCGFYTITILEET